MAKRLPDGLSIETLKAPFSSQLGGMIDKAGGPTAAKVGAAGAFLGAGFDAVSASKQERAFLSDLVEEYRPEIAERLGLAADQVTQEHFEMAYHENPVLAQAKDLSKVESKTRMASGIVGVAAGWFAGMTAAGLTSGAQGGQGAKDSQKNAANIASGIVSTMASMFSGKLTRKVLHRKGEGTLKESAHGQIIAIRDKQLQGQETTPGDIFKVQLALNPEVGGLIAQAYGKPYSQLDEAAQLQVLQSEFPDVLQVNTELARRINDGARPQGLLFGEVEDVKPREMNTTASEPQMRPTVADKVAQAPTERELQHAVEPLVGKDAAPAVASAASAAIDPLLDVAAPEEAPKAPVAAKPEVAVKPAPELKGDVEAKPSAAKKAEHEEGVKPPSEDPQLNKGLEQLFASLEQETAVGGKNDAGKAPSFVQKLEGERARTEQAPPTAARG